MLTGRRPVARAKAPSDVAGVCAGWNGVVDRCLEYALADRYQSADELLGDLRTVGEQVRLGQEETLQCTEPLPGSAKDTSRMPAAPQLRPEPGARHNGTAPSQSFATIPSTLKKEGPGQAADQAKSAGSAVNKGIILTIFSAWILFVVLLLLLNLMDPYGAYLACVVLAVIARILGSRWMKD